MSTMNRPHPSDLAPAHDPRELLTEEQAAYIDGLHDLARFLAEHPDLLDGSEDSIRILDYRMTRGSLRDRVSELGGRWEKESTDHGYFNLIRWFGPHQVQVYTARAQVCERVVSTETVTREIPDPELLAEVPMVTVTEEVERVEWKCPDSLLSSLPIAADEFGPEPTAEQLESDRGVF